MYFIAFIPTSTYKSNQTSLQLKASSLCNAKQNNKKQQSYLFWKKKLKNELHLPEISVFTNGFVFVWNVVILLLFSEKGSTKSLLFWLKLWRMLPSVLPPLGGWARDLRDQWSPAPEYASAPEKQTEKSVPCCWQLLSETAFTSGSVTSAMMSPFSACTWAMAPRSLMTLNTS